MENNEILSLRALLMQSQSHTDETDEDPMMDNKSLMERLSITEDDVVTATIAHEEVVPTPPPSPTSSRPRPSLFSLAQVSSKLGELWSSAKESIFGEDYWIPSDPSEVVLFPAELLKAHALVFPFDDEENSALRVVQGSLKNKPADPIYHLVFSYTDYPSAPAYSIHRSHDLEEALDLCRRCLACQMLFTFLDKSLDNRKQIHELVSQIQLYPLYKMIHIAIVCDRHDLLSDENLEYMEKNMDNFTTLMKNVAHPEGKYPLHLAIELHRLKMVKRFLDLGADVNVRDIYGNTILHYASLDSVQMLELIWEYELSHPLLNMPNNEGYSPVMIAIRAANPRCFSTLIGFGAEMNVRVQGRNPLFEAMQSKGKNTEIIKAILEASPELLSEKDSSGNGALHLAAFKTPLMGLLFLKNKEIDLDGKNRAGQAPLHIYTNKGDIGLMLTIISYCCDINVRDAEGNTPLHLAVSKKNQEATRLLLCLGADPNITNENGDTSRHMAARLKETQLLNALVLCGAQRCCPRRFGCVSGCVYSDIQSASCEESPRLPKDPVVENPLEHNHPIVDFIQKQCYDTLYERLENMDTEGKTPKNLVNLLSLDGGGIRGLVIIQMLMAIEECLGEPIYPYFDWVAGTSTGALVAAALAQGKTLRECQHIYLRFKDLIFDGWTRPFNSNVLESFIKQQMGEDNMDKIDRPRLMISTVKADFFPVKLEFMRNYRMPLTEEQNDELGYVKPEDIPLWKALRRTSAAPMFFSPVDNKYIDGGIIANNPTLDLLSEIDFYNGLQKYLKTEEEKVEIGVVVSLGTGQIPSSPLDPLHVDLNKPLASAYAVMNLSLILIDQVTATEGAPVDRSKSWCNAIGKPFFRLSAPLHKEISLAAKDDHLIAAMMWDCIEYTHKQKPYIEKLCKLIKKTKRYPLRQVKFVEGPSPPPPPPSTSPSPPSPSKQA